MFLVSLFYRTFQPDDDMGNLQDMLEELGFDIDKTGIYLAVV